MSSWDQPEPFRSMVAARLLSSCWVMSWPYEKLLGSWLTPVAAHVRKLPSSCGKKTNEECCSGNPPLHAITSAACVRSLELQIYCNLHKCKGRQAGNNQIPADILLPAKIWTLHMQGLHRCAPEVLHD